MAPKKLKKKKTKAELEAERLAREEEERKQQELEEKRQAEEAERKRIEELRIKAEWKVEREFELERLRKELVELLEIEELRRKQYDAEKAKEDEQLAWENYKDSNDEPDAESEPDMNTFISQILDIKVGGIPATLAIIRKIRYYSQFMVNSFSNNIAKRDAKRVGLCRDYITIFYNLIMSKLDMVTVHILKYTDTIDDSKAGDVKDDDSTYYLMDNLELNIERAVDGVSMGIWASYKEPRRQYKLVDFKEVGVKFDIHRSILTHEKVRYAHRIVRMSIDKFSTWGHEMEGQIMKPYCNQSMPIVISNLSSNPNSNPYSHYMVNATMTRTNKCAIGDIIVYDLLEVGSLPHTIRHKKWKMRDASNHTTSLRRHVFPQNLSNVAFTVIVPSDMIISDDMRIAIWDDENMAWSEDGVTEYKYEVSNRTVFFRSSIVGTYALVRDWSADLPYKNWSLTPITMKDSLINKIDLERVYDKDPFYEQRVRFSVTIKFNMTIVIDVIGTKCMLVDPKIPEFENLIGVESTPGYLLYALQKRGVNIMPSESDCVGLEDIHPKRNDLECDVLRSISRCASACDFMNSPWNQQLESSQIGIFARESTIFTGSNDFFDYENVLAENDDVSKSCTRAAELGVVEGPGVKYTLVMGNEYGTRKLFSSLPRPGLLSCDAHPLLFCVTNGIYIQMS